MPNFTTVISAKSVSFARSQACNVRTPPRASTGGGLAVATNGGFGDECSDTILDHPDAKAPASRKHASRNAKINRFSANKGKRLMTAAEFATEWMAFYPVLWSIARCQFSHHDTEEILQELALCAFRYVKRGHSIDTPSAFFARCLVNQIKNRFRKRKLVLGHEEEIVDPARQNSNKDEDCEHAKHVIKQILQGCSPEEQRAGEAFVATGNHDEAVDALLAQEGIHAPSPSQRNRRHNSYRVAMTRLRHRGRQILRSDDA